MKKILLLFSLVLFLVCGTSGASAASQSLTYDLCKKAGYIAPNNYAEYLPDGFFVGSNCYSWAGENVDGMNVLKSSLSASNYKNNYIFFVCKPGKLSFKVKGRSSSFGTLYTPTIHIVEASGTAASVSVGSELASKSTNGLISADSWTDVEIEVNHDGLIGFAPDHQCYIASVTNTFEGGESTYTVSGTVKDASGNPVEGAAVSITGFSSVESAADGSWSITEIPDGTYTLNAEKEGYSRSSVAIEVNGTDLTGVAVVLREMVTTVSGKFMNILDYAVIPGGHVEFYTRGDTPALVGEADGDDEGQYAGIQIKGVPATYDVKATAPYFESYTSSYTPQSAGEANTYNILMTPRKLTFTLNVADSKTGEPVSGATVTIQAAASETPVTIEESASTPGAYVLGNIKAYEVAETQYTINVAAPDYIDAAPVTFTFSDQDYDGTLQLTPIPPTVITGKITKSDAGAAAGAEVSLTAAGAEEPAATVVADAEGVYTFSIEGVPEASYTVTAGAEYYESAQEEVAGVERGKTYAGVNMTLVPVTYTYSARVVDAKQIALQGAKLTFDGVELTPDAAGVFTTTVKAHEAAGKTYTVVASAPFYKSATYSVQFEASDVTAVYNLEEEMLNFTATVRNVGGAPVETAVLTFDGNTLTPDSDGIFSTSVKAKDAEGKSYKVSVTAHGYAEISGDVQFDGADVTKDYVLDEVVLTFTADVTGIAGDGTRSPLDNAVVEASDGTNEFTLANAGNGVYTFTETLLASEGKTYTVTAQCEDYESAESFSFSFEGKDAAHSFVLNHMSGISAIISAMEAGAGIYDINGRRISLSGGINMLPAGIYIVNGRKILIK